MTANKSTITVLKWDLTGRYILIGDLSGNVQVFSQRDNLFSDWVQYYQVRIGSEQIINAAFFHNGRKIAMPQDKKDITNYMEKYQRTPFLASCRGFGGCPADGVIVVTQSKLVGAFVIPPDIPNTKQLNATTNPVTLPIVLHAETLSLAPSRSYITIADISHTKSEYLINKYTIMYL